MCPPTGGLRDLRPGEHSRKSSFSPASWPMYLADEKAFVFSRKRWFPSASSITSFLFQKS